jgi:hypothetical protein
MVGANFDVAEEYITHVLSNPWQEVLMQLLLAV